MKTQQGLRKKGLRRYEVMAYVEKDSGEFRNVGVILEESAGERKKRWYKTRRIKAMGSKIVVFAMVICYSKEEAYERVREEALKWWREQSSDEE